MLAAWLALAASAQEVDGFIEVRGEAQVGVDGTWWRLVQRGRTSLEVPFSKRLVASATVELALTEGRDPAVEIRRLIEASELGPIVCALCTWPQASEEPAGALQIRPSVFLDRLHLDAYLPWVDLRVGRQAITWGSGLLVNPTDPVPQVLYTEPWRPRVGQNAARATFPIGDQHQVQLVLGTDDDFRHVRVFGRGTVNVKGWDLSAVGAWRGDDGRGFVGLDVRGTATVGLWFEGAMHVGEGGYREGWWEEFVVGLDYSWPVLDRIFIAGQYLRNGRGKPMLEGPQDLIGRVSTGLTAPDCGALGGFDTLLSADPEPFALPFGGRDYLLLVARVGFIPELALTLTALQNLGDGTGSVVPVLTARPTGWLELNASAQVPYALVPGGGELRPGPSLTRVEVEPLEGAAPLVLDLAPLVPDATVSVWARAVF